MPVKVIAEIGCNHMGKMEIAKEMIETARYICRVFAVKFQKRNPKECLSMQEYNAPHPEPYHSFGKTYGEHREYLEFTIKQHQQLKKYCERLSLVYSSSVWDLISTKEIVSLGPDFIKVPSACNTNFTMLEYLCKKYRGKIHISLGMTRRDEEREIVKFMTNHGRNKDTVLYACTSAYPVEDKDVCLYEINRLKRDYGKQIMAVGFSGHHKGIAIDVAAFILGAQFIERHFTLDRTQKGTDHAASLEPEGMRRIVRDIKSVSWGLRHKTKQILDSELYQRKKLKWDRFRKFEA